MKGHPYSDEKDEKNLHKDSVNDTRTTFENRKTAACIHCGGTNEMSTDTTGHFSTELTFYIR